MGGIGPGDGDCGRRTIDPGVERRADVALRGAEMAERVPLADSHPRQLRRFKCNVQPSPAAASGVWLLALAIWCAHTEVLRYTIMTGLGNFNNMRA